MTDWLLGLVPAYGVWLLTAATFLSCLALPIPASILMLAAGGFAAVGDLSLPVISFGALVGAVAGDQIGYLAGRKGGAGLLARMHHKNAPLKNTPLQKAVALLARRGGGAVFFSRWLVSALGPYVNLAAGAARQPWAKFTAFGVAGELVWVSVYVGTGYAFAGNLAAASAMAVDVLGMLAAGGIAVALGWWLFTLRQTESPQPD